MPEVGDLLANTLVGGLMADGQGEHVAHTTAAEQDGAVASARRGDKVLIYEGELAFMARFVTDYPEIETGGDLFGFWTHSGSPVVEYVLGPATAANHQDVAFYQEASYLRSAGAALRDHHGLQHVGTWHSHHRLGLTEPSTGDSKTMQHAVDKNLFPGWLLTICNFADTSNLVEMRGYLYHAEGEGRHDQLTWIVLPGTSPIRSAMSQVPDFVHAEPDTPSTPFEAIPATSFTAIAASPVNNATFPSTSFLAMPEGRDEFRRLYEQLLERHAGTEILQRDDGRVALAFTHEGYTFEIVFPHSFPLVKPVVECRPVDIPEGQEESWAVRRTMVVDVERGDDVVAAVEDLVDRFLRNRTHPADDRPPTREL
jgi:hypothetical protein